jgi:hypothetical protein
VTDETDLRTARITKWGFAGLLIFAGAMFFHSQWRDGMPSGDVAVCAAAALLGFGLLLNLSVARWLALGVCFLLIVAAIVLPVLRFLLQPPGTSPGAVFSNALFAVFMITFGGIGYRALSYLRSQLGRSEYAGTPEREERLQKEGSSAVALSAGAWVLFFGASWFAGMRLPTQLVLTSDAEADSARELAAWRAQEGPESPAASDAAPPPQRRDPTGPDIAPVGLCSSGEMLVVMAYENLGRASRDEDFKISYNDKSWDTRSRSSVDGKLPPPGNVGLAALGYIGSLGGEEDSMNLVRVFLDSRDDVRESDEVNNDAEYSLSWRSFADLPSCESLQSAKR